MSLPVALVITRNLPPLIGGMERLVWHIVDELRTEYAVCVVGPEGCSEQLPGGVEAHEVPLRPLWRFLLGAAWRSLDEARRRRPRLILAGSGLTAPLAWLAARLTGARCVVYLHGLDVEARHPVYRLFWRRSFRHFDQVLVNSRFTWNLALAAGVLPERITLLHPGVALPDMALAESRRTAFRERHGLDDAPVMLYLGRITARKGLAPFIRDILPIIVTAQPRAKLVVIGEEPTRALNRHTGERQLIEHSLDANGLRHSVRLLGEFDQDNPEIEAAYFAADVLIFPVQARAHDNEGFGMVAIEAAAHGLPTVAFSVGGVTDAISDPRSGHLIPPDANEAFAKAVLACLIPTPGRAANCRAFASKFAWTTFGQRLRETFRSQTTPR